MAAEGFANKDGVWSLQNEATKERTAQARPISRGLPAGCKPAHESMHVTSSALFVRPVTCAQRASPKHAMG